MKIPQCQECGACCAYNSISWIEVSKEDAKRLGDPSLYHKVSDGVKMPDNATYAMNVYKDGYMKRCICLEGVIGSKVKCSIYSKRPEGCRKLQRGDPQCIYLVGWHRLGRAW